MEKHNITWSDLYDHIATMTEEERNKPVLVWGEEQPLCNNVALCVEVEDMVMDPEDIDQGAMLRSDFDQDYEPEVVLNAGITYLYR